MMTTSYLFWIAVVLLGAIAGLFIRPRIIAITLVGMFSVCLVGLITCLFMKADAMAWTFGILGGVVPPVFVVAYILGVVVHSMITGKVSEKIVPAIEQQDEN
jgi:predicted branched-subunit amino acid permease